MLIGVVTTSYPRYVGDPAGSFVAGLNRYMVRRGHRVEVLAAGSPGLEVRPEVVEAGIRVLRVPSSIFYAGGAPDALSSGLAARIEAVRFSAALGELLWRRRRFYDALVSHWLLPCGVLGTVLGQGRPHVAVAHSSDVHLMRRLRLQVVARAISRRARLVYTSDSLRIEGAEGVVASMGIEHAEFAASDKERAVARMRLGISGPTVLFLGRLVPVKGIEVLLAALAARPALRACIAGDGPLRGMLEEKAAPLGTRVRFFGEVFDAPRRDLLMACDALVLPSLRLADGRTEGAPLVVLEALAAGCVVIASAVGGIPDLLGELKGDGVQLVPPGDSAALMTALDRALLLSSADEETVAAARDRRSAYATRFDWEHMAPRILGSLLER